MEYSKHSEKMVSSQADMSPNGVVETIEGSFSTYSSNIANENIFKKFIDSFKPYDYSKFPFSYDTDDDENPFEGNQQRLSSNLSSTTTTESRPHLHPGHPQFDYSRLTELERAAMVTSTSPLSKSLKARHISLISLGGAIGTGLFVGSGSALAAAGPFGLLIVWAYMSSIVFVTMASLAELATAFPVSGAFITFNTLFIDSSWGFAMAWNYAIQWLIIMPLELVAASITIQYWNTDIDPAIFVAIFYVIIVIINIFGVKGYGEVESFFSILKILAIIGFTILSIILICGGGGHKFIGGSNWHPPEGGMFNAHEPFKQCCYILTSTAFAFAGVELFGLASCETANPKNSIPKAMKHVFWRILVFYIASIIMIGLLVPYTSPHLIGNNQDIHSRVNINTSPFVIAIKNAQIPVLPSIMNVVIIITIISVGNASVYGSSRTLAALGALRQGPAILNYIDRKGRPLAALLVQFIIGLLCFLVALPGTNRSIDVLHWLLSLSGLSTLFTYLSICICHLRFRKALDDQARIAKDELVYTGSVIGSWYGVVSIVIILGLQFWAALFPPNNNGEADLSKFFKIYLGCPFILLCYICHKIYAKIYLGIPLRKLWLRIDEIDVDTGRREIDLEVLKQEVAEERLTLHQKPWYFKLYKFFC